MTPKNHFEINWPLVLLNPSLNLLCHYDRNREIKTNNYNCIYLLWDWLLEQEKDFILSILFKLSEIIPVTRQCVIESIQFVLKY